MSVTGINQAAGADLLNLFSQSVGQGSVDIAASASAAQLKVAVAETKLNEAFLVGSGGSDPGNQLNVYA